MSGGPEQWRKCKNCGKEFMSNKDGYCSVDCVYATEGGEFGGGDAGIKLWPGPIIKNGKQAEFKPSLADEHWSYVNNTLHEHGVDEETLRLIGYHYRTAFIHGYKHGVEDSE